MKPKHKIPSKSAASEAFEVKGRLRKVSKTKSGGPGPFAKVSPRKSPGVKKFPPVKKSLPVKKNQKRSPDARTPSHEPASSTSVSEEKSDISQEDTVTITMKQDVDFDTFPLGFTLTEVGKKGTSYTNKFALAVIPDDNSDLYEEWGISKGDGVLSINGVDVSAPGTQLKVALKEIRKGAKKLPLNIEFALCN
mmetsp:Transcript_36555/g.58657  ORF Transcript_36555/g.58657 Transcript_36555/m.58657 type:complete len:193 (+) Transcript_36555:235-813(+)